MISKITVSNIYIEDLFQWFHDAIMDSCGDGCGTIVCENWKECSELFLTWWKEKYGRDKFYHEPDYTKNSVNFHDCNENFIFTDTIYEHNFDGDYVFVVTGECKTSGTFSGRHGKTYLLKPVQNDGNASV